MPFSFIVIHWKVILKSPNTRSSQCHDMEGFLVLCTVRCLAASLISTHRSQRQPLPSAKDTVKSRGGGGSKSPTSPPVEATVLDPA